MPTSPEVLKAGCEVRLTEVDHKVESKQLGAAAGDVAVAAEVSVDLEGEGVGSEHGDPSAAAHLAVEGGIRQLGAAVGDDALAEESGEDEHAAVIDALRIEAALLLNLGQEMSWSLNGAGDQVREEADEQGVLDQRIGGLRFALIDIGYISDLLEGVERDRRRQDDLPQSMREAVKADQTRHSCEGVDEEVEVLEVTEKAEVQRQ